MHRSIPHGGGWPDIPGLVAQIKKAGFEPRLLVPIRADDVTWASQVTQGHVRSIEQARTNMLRAHRHIVDALARLPDVWFRFVLYEELAHDHYVQTLFGGEMGLTLPANHPRFQDKDEKHRKL